VTPGAADRVHLSIGEVLANLQDEFPDVTISKIRFLESQGLIDPERTPSGYRKFYAEDLDRLRWILYQQREHFLPLRVIKERLDRFGSTGAPAIDSNGSTSPPPTIERNAQAPERARPRPRDVTPDAPGPPTLPLDDFDGNGDSAPEAELGDVEDDDSEPSANELTRSELLRSAGISDAQLDELEAYALIVPLVGEGERALYDEESAAVARLAGGFHARGIEARHLKMYQHFADRESALFAQVLVRYVRQRNPAARSRLQEELEELARLGRQLRTAMLRAALRDSLTE
jgi:DNA-binding transcriptional MerR regulator